MSDNIGPSDMPRYGEREQVPETPAWVQDFLDAEEIRARTRPGNEGDYD